MHRPHLRGGPRPAEIHRRTRRGLSPLKPPPAIRRRVLRPGPVAAAVAFLLLLGLAWRDAVPPLPDRLDTVVVFPAARPGTAEPLLVAGQVGAGDLLAVRYLDAATAVFVYDVWGAGGPVSPPFELRPGQPRRLELTLPVFARIRGARSDELRPLRVVLDGRPLLDASVPFSRVPGPLVFAANPLGGTVAGPAFRGQLALADGRPLAGPAAALFSAAERLPWLVRGRPAAFARDLLLAALAGFAVAGLVRLRPPAAPVPVFSAAAVPPRRWFFFAAGSALLLFAAVLTGGSFRILFADTFASFYDHQAAAFLHGRLDVPPEALEGEAFVFEGKTYGYFGPTPAVLRLPFVAAGVGFGRLTRLFLLLYFAAALVAVYLLLQHVVRLAAGPRAWPAPLPTVLLVGLAGAGSTLFFVSSRAYVYHEAILCGVAFALWAVLFSLRWLAAPERALWVGALLCGLASVHARPPVGLFALSVVGSAALLLAGRAGFNRALPPVARLRAARRPFAIAVLAGLGVLSFNGFSYLKFRSFDGAPLRLHVQYDEARLDRIRNRNFHLENIPFNFSSYVTRPDFDLRPQFPYVALRAPAGDIFPEARIDVAEPIAGMPYTMPALVLLALAAFPAAWFRWPAARLPLLAVAGGAFPMTLALLLAAAVSQRYTADFCPPLLAAAAFGVVALDLLPPRLRLPARIALALLAAVSIVITVAITLHHQGETVWGVPDDIRQRYASLRAAFDGFFGPGPAGR